MIASATFNCHDVPLLGKMDWCGKEACGDYQLLSAATMSRMLCGRGLTCHDITQMMETNVGPGGPCGHHKGELRKILNYTIFTH